MKTAEIQITVKNVRSRPGGWEVCFDHGQPTDPANLDTRYHTAFYQHPHGGYLGQPFRVGQVVAEDEI